MCKSYISIFKLQGLFDNITKHRIAKFNFFSKFKIEKIFWNVTQTWHFWKKWYSLIWFNCPNIFYCMLIKSILYCFPCLTRITKFRAQSLHKCVIVAEILHVATIFVFVAAFYGEKKRNKLYGHLTVSISYPRLNVINLWWKRE